MHGHGKPDEGAQSSTGTTEAATNLKIALKLQNLLEQSDIEKTIKDRFSMKYEDVEKNLDGII